MTVTVLCCMTVTCDGALLLAATCDGAVLNDSDGALLLDSGI